MTEKELKKLSRADLLEMLIEQSVEVQSLRERLTAAEAELQRREISINNAGSIAEASLRLNSVFEAAQASCDQYIRSICALNQRQADICAEIERDSREKAEALLAETKMNCEKMESETKVKCDEMVAKAKAEAQSYWNEITNKLDTCFAEHVGLREHLSIALLERK